MKLIGTAPFFSLGVFLRWLGSAKKKMVVKKKPLLTCSKNAICQNGGL
ncbi:MAG: hypothetical protein KKH41_05515 [Candidatus Thermoplasmatota archaeon]|nr:hypothetical protein [Candidatus Thermoplasmatota archaeon]MBU4072187.1 hypothetical protein [Candidatus Thermoplasmatota archaeon]MBU4145011.1 hypothetical protein [Candidatus Thermoplasmatota archaeon]MBU4592025.1 hypothetical protein [Candidatus Thermoplasmatota archaeon]